uniref:E3 ubiquitin-protein ligase RNF220 middle domain-containing protein n=1 Tax=Leptobrachium leishanense TaxID=445787 RepID=A0A8C5QX34_9ANUR
MKRRKQDEGQRESCMNEDDSVDIENENGHRFEEYEWCGQKRIRATTLLEGGFRGSGFIMCSSKENHDSDADLDVDGDDTLEYGKAQYTEADIIPCTGEEPGETKEREALRGAVLNGGTPSTRITTEFSKWASDEMPSTSNGESSKLESMQKTCKNSDIEKITEESAVTTFEALKARIRELERQLSRGDRYKCLICMVSRPLRRVFTGSVLAQLGARRVFTGSVLPQLCARCAFTGSILAQLCARRAFTGSVLAQLCARCAFTGSVLAQLCARCAFTGSFLAQLCARSAFTRSVLAQLCACRAFTGSVLAHLCACRALTGSVPTQLCAAGIIRAQSHKHGGGGLQNVLLLRE